MPARGGLSMHKESSYWCKVIPLLFVSALIVPILAACGSGEEEEETPTPPPSPTATVAPTATPAIKLTGTAFPTSRQGTDVEWYAPRAWMELPLNTYYVEVDMANMGSEKIDLPGVEAYFYGEDSDILLIRVVQPGELKPGKKVTFHLDTTGYTTWLLMSLHNKDAPVTLCVSLTSKAKVVSSFATTLPPYLEFRGYESLRLNFSLTDYVPDVDKLQPLKADELRIPGAFGLGSPAAIRKQGDETAIYFYYRKSEVQKL